MENPALLFGIPLIGLGALGFFAFLALMLQPQPAAAGEASAPRHEGAHPGPAEYVQIGLILAFITAVEVAVYYVDAIEGVLVPILLLLSAVKFALVVLWFMHLRFDNRLFSTMFTGGFLLALAVFIVVLSTLGASLR